MHLDPTDGDGESVAGTIAIPMGVRGKFYWELDVTAGTGGGLDFGIVRSDQTQWMDGTLSNRLFNQPEFSGLLGNSGIRSKTGTDSDVSNYLSATANGSSQTFMVCVDALEGKLWIGKDGCGVKMEALAILSLGLNPGASNLFTDTRFSYLPVMMCVIVVHLRLFGTLDKNPLSLHHLKVSNHSIMLIHVQKL